MLFKLKSMARNQGYIQSMCKNLLKYLTCALALIRTFSFKQQKPAEAGEMKMEFIINMQGILWNPDEEMQVASGWPGIRSQSAREP